MSITVTCYVCEKELDEPGALVFSPPYGSKGANQVTKRHLCRTCWRELDVLMRSVNQRMKDMEAGMTITRDEPT